MRHDLRLGWLRMKRHLRSCGDVSRAHRDAARAPSGDVFAPARFRGPLCRASR
jgi:hypothetical protein